MIKLRDFVFYSTIAGVFSSGFMYEIGTFRIIFFYLVMIFNLGILAYLGEIWCPPGLIYLSIYICISGFVGLLNGTDTALLFVKELLGIFFASLYFCSVIKLVDFDVAYCFKTYARFAYYVAAFGFVLLPFQTVLNLRDPDRLRSVLSEPAAFATVCLPAFYYYVDLWRKGSKVGKQVLIFTGAYILAGSSTGFIGIMFGLYLLSKRIRYAQLLIPFVILALGLGIYVSSSNFRLRLDDSIGYIRGSDIGDSNLSTFVLASNLYVAQRIFSEHPLVGGGVGSHYVSHERFVDEVVGFDNWKNNGFRDLNAYDGNSLLLRSVSETGLIGVCLLFWSIWRFRPRGNGDSLTLGRAISVYLFVCLLRIGTYINLEEVFFVALYIINALPLAWRIDHRQMATVAS